MTTKKKFPHYARVINNTLATTKVGCRYNDRVLMLGEIVNMPGHYVFLFKGKVFEGYHYDCFEYIHEDNML